MQRVTLDFTRSVRVKQLQFVIDTAARVLTKTKKMSQITPVLKSLHWFPFINVKIFLIVLFVS